MRASAICSISTILAVVFISGCATTHDKRMPWKENSFALHLIKEKEQKDVWRFSTFKVDLDRVELEDIPLVTEKDIESFDGTAIHLKKPMKLPDSLSATGLYFVIVVDGERELLGNFLSTWSSLWPDEATTMVHWQGNTVDQI